MDKRYIDFVPVNKRGSAPKSVVGAAPGATSGASGVASTRGARVPGKASARESRGSGVAGTRDTEVLVRNGAPKRMRVKTPASFEEEEEDFLAGMFEERPRPAGVSTGLNEPKYGVIEEYRPRFVQTEVKKRPLGVSGGAARGGAAGIGSIIGGATGVSGGTKTARPKMAEINGKVARPKAVKPMNMVDLADPIAMKAANSGAARGGSAGAAARGGSANAVARSKAHETGPAEPLWVKFMNTGKTEKRPLSAKSAEVKAPVEEALDEKKSAQKPEKKASRKLAKKPDKKSTTKKAEGPVRIIAKPEKDSRAGMIVAVILTIILGAAAGTVAFLLLPK